jgi:hypothetical protein
MAEREGERKRKRLAGFVVLLLCIEKKTFGRYVNFCGVSRTGYVPTFIGLSGRHMLTFQCDENEPDKNERHFRQY